MQGERKAKCKAFGFAIFFAEPQPILSKDSARRAQSKIQSQRICIFFAEPPPILAQQSVQGERKAKCKAFGFAFSLFRSFFSLFHIEHQSFQVFPFGMVDVDGVVGRLVQLVQDAHMASALGGRCEHSQAELLFADSL